MRLLSYCSNGVPARHILCFMLFTGFMATFLLRVNLSLAIVAMVNSTKTNSDDFLLNATDQCGRNATDSNSESHKSEIVGEFDWNEFQQSVILSAFFWGYLIFQIPGGRIAELYGIKKVFGASILVNGVLNLLTPVAASLHWSLILGIRAIQGLAQGVAFPCLSAAVARWIPPKERARFISFAIQGASIGLVVALPLCGWIMSNWGWRAVFYGSGCIALVWCVAWAFLIYDSPQLHPRISTEEKAFLETNVNEWKPDAPSVPWLSVFSSLQFWVGVGAAMGNDWGFHMFGNFGPKYVKSALGFDLEQSSLLTSLPYLCQYIFTIGYSAFCDFLLEKNVATMTVRKMSVIICNLGPAVAIVSLSFAGCDVTLAVAILTFAITVIGAMSCGFFQNPLDIAPNYAGSLTGVTNTVGALMGIISTPLTGAILQTMGSPEGWKVVFWISSAMFLVTSLPYLLLANGKIQPWNDLSTQDSVSNLPTNISNLGASQNGKKTVN